MSPLRIVSICRTLPTPDNPSAGIFVRRRLEAMARRANVSVVQPVPYFPGVKPLPAWLHDARDPQLETVRTPMFYVPGIAKALDARWLARSVAPAVREALRQRIEEAWSIVDAHLAAHGPYFLGAQCSGADLLALMYMRWSRNMPRPVTAWPALKQYADTLRARPSWQRLCDIEGLTDWRA